MKKIFFSLLLAGAAGAVSAQDVNQADTTIKNSMDTTKPATVASNDSIKLHNPDTAVIVSTTTDSTNRMNAVTETTNNNDTTKQVVENNTATNNTVVDSSGTASTQANSQVTDNSTASLPVGVHVASDSALQNGLNKFSSLPILNTYVPETVVSQIKNQFGDKLYDITQVKEGENEYSYNVRIQEDGVYKVEKVNENGSSVTMK